MKNITNTYNVKGMHCESCVEKISNTLEKIEGVESIDIDLNTSEARIKMSPNLDLSTLNAALKPLKKYELKEKSSTIQDNKESDNKEKVENLTPLFIIVGYLAGGIILRALISDDFSITTLMTNFMGGFFIIFSLFKMIDIQGFAEGYATYDIIASRSSFYAKSYPFIELILGVLYFSGILPVLTNIVTAILMFIGAIGVTQALREKRTIQCACLGTSLKLPMTKVTLVEDVLMGVMAIVMLF